MKIKLLKQLRKEAREITPSTACRFRGKRLRDKQWVVDDLIENQGRFFIYHASSESTLEDNGDGFITVVAEEVDSATVGGYWRSVNGFDLFAGDIIRINVGTPPAIRVVCFSELHHSFSIYSPYRLRFMPMASAEEVPALGWWDDFGSEIEVVGNIYDSDIKNFLL
jgi:hypothetical protein